MKSKMFWIGLSLIVSTMLMAADDVSLRVKGGLTGHYPDSNMVRVDELDHDSDSIVVQVVVSDLSFALAGAEFEIRFPTYLTFIEEAPGGVYAVGTSPFSAPTGAEGWGTTSIQLLPANNNAQQTDDTFNNNNGRGRGGIVVSSADARLNPGAGPFVLAEMRFRVGTIDSHPLRPGTVDNNCVSSTSQISLTFCGTGSTNSPCEIFADSSAGARAMTAGNLTVTLAHNSALQKGNLSNYKTTNPTNDTNINVSDVVQLVDCLINGQSSAGCDLAGLSIGEYEQVADLNCSNDSGTFAPNVSDVVAMVSLITGDITRTGKRMETTYDFPGEKGVLFIDNQNRVGAGATLEIAVQGDVKFGAVILEEADERAGWSVSANYLPASGVYKMLFLNMNGQNTTIPSVQIPYSGAKNVSIGMMHAELASNNGAIAEQGFAPVIEDFTDLEKPRDRE